MCQSELVEDLCAVRFDRLTMTLAVKGYGNIKELNLDNISQKLFGSPLDLLRVQLGYW